jgi:thiaminase
MDLIERGIYENAIKLICEPGYKFILSRMCEDKKNSIYVKMLDHYEGSEEYEKCQIIKESVLNTNRLKQKD